MNARALLVLGTLFVSPAWAQEPSFDLKSDAARKIVRDTASLQSVVVQVVEVAPRQRDASAPIRFVPPEKPPAPVAPPRPAAVQPASSPAVDIFATVIDTFVDSLLDIQHDDVTQEQYEVWRACQARDEKCLLPPAPVPGSKLELHPH